MMLANLDYASFTSSNCQEAVFIWAGNFEYADFENADLTGAVLEDMTEFDVKTFEQYNSTNVKEQTS